MNTNQLITALMFAALSVFTVAATSVSAQDTAPDVEHGINFVDEDGDGYNDTAPDSDNDGIPNGQDADYTRNAGAGQNQGNRGQAATGDHGNRFVDEDGDGFNDNAPDADGDGIPNGQDSDYEPQGQALRKNNASGTGSGNAWANSKREHTGGQHQAGTLQQQRLRDGSGAGAGSGAGTGAHTHAGQHSGTGAQGMRGNR